MTFEEALKHLRKGAKVRREIWIDAYLVKVNNVIAICDIKGNMQVWNPSVHELLERDWVSDLVMDSENAEIGKQKTGKPVLTLVPVDILWAIEKIREYGLQKYSDPDNWKVVDAQDYWEAVLRHTVKAWGDFHALDEESGMPHIWHIACNLAFIIALEEEKRKNECKNQ